LPTTLWTETEEILEEGDLLGARAFEIGRDLSLGAAVATEG
jgi:hypothetical protein